MHELKASYLSVKTKQETSNLHSSSHQILFEFTHHPKLPTSATPEFSFTME